MATRGEGPARDAAPEDRPSVALIANAHEWTARSLESLLGPAGYAILRAHTGREALRRALAVRPDLVILDLELPDLRGPEVCRRLRADPRIARTTPILIAHSAPPIRQQRLEALRAGAWDLVVLPIDAGEFLLKVSAYVRAKIDVDRARHESLLDESSGLYNARGTLRRATELASDAYRHRKALACIVFAADADPVRGLGSGEEEASERATSRLAASFKRLGRTSDVVGRLGRSEFVVIAGSTDAEGARNLAERMLREAEHGGEEDGVARVQLRAGCFAVPDYREAHLQPVDLLVRATLALRRSQAHAAVDRIQFFTERARPAQRVRS
jgi:PleD family two-component response regulator